MVAHRHNSHGPSELKVMSLEEAPRAVRRFEKQNRKKVNKPEKKEAIKERKSKGRISDEDQSDDSADVYEDPVQKNFRENLMRLADTTGKFLGAAVYHVKEITRDSVGHSRRVMKESGIHEHVTRLRQDPVGHVRSFFTSKAVNNHDGHESKKPE